MKNLFRCHLKGFVQWDLIRSDSRTPWPFRMICIIEAVATPVTDKVSIHGFTETSFKPHHFAILGTGNDVASERAVDAERRTSLKIPPPAREAGGLIRIDSGRTDVDDVSREGTFELTIRGSAKIGVVGDLKSSQITIAGELLIETPAPPALDTAVHLVLDEYPQVLIGVGSLLSEVAPDPMTSGHREILKQTMSPFITDRTVVGMVHHEPFNDMFAEIDCFFIGGRYCHAITGVNHATHLDPLDRTLKKLYRADPASANGSKTWVEAEPWDDNTQPRRSLYHLRPLLNLYFKAVNL